VADVFGVLTGDLPPLGLRARSGINSQNVFHRGDERVVAKKASAGELGTDLYWSSSQLEKMWTHSLYVAFTGGALGQDMLQNAHGVHPVPAF